MLCSPMRQIAPHSSLFVSDGLIPLHYASENGHLAVVEALVAAKSDVNAKDV